MAFKFAARTVLELGKELISSDEVAIYELIKNAVDAKSPKIEIEAQIVLRHSSYVLALEELDEGISPTQVIETVRSGLMSNAPVAAARDLIETLERLVDRPTRFRAALMAAYARHSWIQVTDRGSGMSLESLDRVFLTIGTRSRREENAEGALYLGDKGVGRLSTMRLGERLLVTSATAEQPNWGRLRINWGLFSHDSDVSIEDIDIYPVLGPVKSTPDEQGTTIRISMLSADWTPGRFDDVMKGRIARMVDPFTGLAKDLLVARYNGARVLIPSVPQKLLNAAHATCKIRFFFEKSENSVGQDDELEPVLAAEIDYGHRQKNREITFRGVEIYSMTQRDSKRRGKRGHAAFENIRIRPKALVDLGPFEANIYWYNRKIIDAIADLTEKQQETRDLITQWAGGPMLYRHGYRVLPYGEPSDDWLELDRNAFGESGFKLNRRQIIGEVKIHSSHLSLSEQTNRQGLIESDAEAALRKMLMVMLHVHMRQLINEADDAEKIRKRDEARSLIDFHRTHDELGEALKTLTQHLSADQIPYANKVSSTAHALVEQCSSAVSVLDKALAQSEDDREKFLHLAGVGLLTEFIFHELDRAVRHTLRALATAKSDKQHATMQSLEDQLVTLQKRVSAFDDMTGEKRQTKTIFALSDVVNFVIAGHEMQFERHQIKVHFDPVPFQVKAVRGMVVQILENLIANAVYWLNLQAEYQTGFKPEIWISIDPETKALTVEDNGPGVEPGRSELIFQPFISSKPPGQGRGLGLYISRELAAYHKWMLTMDPEPGRRRPGRLNMFALDMGVA